MLRVTLEESTEDVQDIKLTAWNLPATLALQDVVVHDNWSAAFTLSNPGPKPVPKALLIAAFLAGFAMASAAAAAADGCPAVLDYTFNSLQTGKPESLCQYRGKVLLIVNTASYCGYTHQYEGLEALYRKYKDRGLVVLGFPTNDFGGQEPGTNNEIAEFCRLTYGVQFPMFEKSSIKTIKSNPLFAELISRTGKAPEWNFHKYLVDRDGIRVASFGTRVEPESRELVSALEKLLSEKPGSPGS
jgi:glutathione peroxidase